MDSALLATLRAHNPWLDQPADQGRCLTERLPTPFIPRQHELHLRPGRAELVVGPRQAGKSTWIHESLSHVDAPVLVLHGEEPRIRELAASAALATTTLSEVAGPNSILFFEEVQHLPDASLFIKGLVDLDRTRRIVATGSSSFDLRARTRESLAGRARRTRLLPFSLREVAQTVPANLVAAVHHARLAELWKRLLVTGGYPDAWFDANPEPLLRHLVEAFVLRDASDLHTIERPSVFRKLLELAAADIGNIVNVAQWASLAQVSRNTALRYLGIAEQAHVLRLVSPFIGGRRAEVTSAQKVFFVDNGLRNALFGGFLPCGERADRGALWENAVFGELAKRLDLLDEIRFWRSKNGAEVDFVIRRHERILAIEVKAAPLRRPAVSRAARSFIEAYRPVCLGVVNSTLRLDTVVAGVPVWFRRPWELEQLLVSLDDG